MKELFKKDCVKKICYDYKDAQHFKYIHQRSVKIAQVEHMPIETLRAEKNGGEGEIQAYYYAPDWSEVKKTTSKRIPALELGLPIEIFLHPTL